MKQYIWHWIRGQPVSAVSFLIKREISADGAEGV